MYFKPIESTNSIDEAVLAQEWDGIAQERAYLIQSGTDISLLDVTEPFVIKNICQYQPTSILDCGCGTGHLSALIAKKLNIPVDAIDFSGVSIDIAKQEYTDINDLNFYRSSILSHSKLKKSYECCIANMVLMDITNLEDNLKAIRKMLKDTGVFVCTITHPCFWPIYWNYFNEQWFDYNKEICIKAPFKVNGKILTETTHIHRPLENYLSCFEKSGFKLKEVHELYPTSSHLEIGYSYNYPRFIGFVCTAS